MKCDSQMNGWIYIYFKCKYNIYVKEMEEDKEEGGGSVVRKHLTHKHMLTPT